MRALILPALALSLLATAATAGAQSVEAPERNRVGVAPVPFGPGERSDYQVKLGIFTVGEGHMEVHGVESIRGSSTYHVSMRIRGGRLGMRVNSTFQSWMDIRTLASRRFIQDQNEVRYSRFRQFEFFPEEKRFERADSDEKGSLPTDHPLDDISFVYYARTLPLKVGETYTLPHYFQERGNPVVIRVIRKDRVEVPAGTFNTIVVQPVIQTRGIFGEGGEAEIHFSDDDRRIMVQMRSRGIPLLGSLTLHLTDIRYARPLRAISFGAGERASGEGGP